MKTLKKQLKNRFNLLKKKESKSGFTIIETMVAIFILTIALTSLINLTARSLFAARYARNEITANYLAQEAADYIRNERDTIAFQKRFSGGSWDSFLNKFGLSGNQLCFSTNGCYFGVNDSLATSIVSCSGECPFLKYRDTGNSYYYYSSSGDNSIFRRTVKMQINSSNPDEVYVTVTVSWNNGNAPKSKVLRFSLLKWLDNN